jgi:hypothetical protein
MRVPPATVPRAFGPSAAITRRWTAFRRGSSCATCRVWQRRLDTIDRLARLRLNARWRGRRLQLRNLDGALKELTALIGLRDTLPPRVSTAHPQSQPLRTPIDTQAGGGGKELGVLPVSSRRRPDLNQ